MDKGKSFILIIVIIVAVIFVAGIFYIIGGFVFKDNSSDSLRDPKVVYKKFETEKIIFEKTDTTSEIDYDFKIKS